MYSFTHTVLSIRVHNTYCTVPNHRSTVYEYCLTVEESTFVSSPSVR